MTIKAHEMWPYLKNVEEIITTDNQQLNKVGNSIFNSTYARSAGVKHKYPMQS